LHTPASLSLELQIPQKRIRDILRRRYETLPQNVNRWELDEEMTAAVRAATRSHADSNSPVWTLQVGDQIRRRAVHAAYGGQQQGGISTPRRLRDILVFTDPIGGARYGYERFEGLREDGSYSYTGEGQHGHQAFVRGNLALRDAAKNVRTIRLFTTRGSAATYVGAFSTGEPSYRIDTIPDVDGLPRRGIIFNLIPLDADVTLLPPYGGSKVSGPKIMDWTPPDFSDVVVEFDATLAPGERVVSRLEFELQADFGGWLVDEGLVPSRLTLPSGAFAIEPDLYVESNGWIVEAKKSTARTYVRTAIGQVLDYAHVAKGAGKAAVPMVLLPGKPAQDLIELMNELGIILAVRSEDGFDLLAP
jgi:hypothetical protein